MATTYLRTTHVMFSEVGDDIVALDVDAGQCFGMGDVAADVWRLLAEPQDLDMLCHNLRQRYDVGEDQCRQEVGQLLEELIAEDLVRTV